MSAKLGIVIASGMLKGVFSHGVLSAFEDAGITADVYGVASSATLSGGLAAIGKAREAGVGYWQQAAATAAGKGMSQVVLSSLAQYGPLLREGIFRPGAPRLLLAASRVTSPAAADLTQGPQARALGERLLMDVLNRDPAWVSENLAAAVFDSAGQGRTDGRPALTPANFDEVAYASTRMLHAWDIPASVAGEAYVDASYTCACPAREVAATGVTTLVAVSSEHRALYRDLYRTERIEDGSVLGSAVVRVIKPEADLQTLGVGFAEASAPGLLACYQLGLDTGRAFLAGHPGLAV
jgi:hypothetical protein